MIEGISAITLATHVRLQQGASQRPRPAMPNGVSASSI